MHPTAEPATGHRWRHDQIEAIDIAAELAASAQDVGALGAWLFACATKLPFAGVLAGQRAVMPPTQRSSSFARS